MAAYTGGTHWDIDPPLQAKKASVSPVEESRRLEASAAMKTHAIERRNVLAAIAEQERRQRTCT